MLRAVATTVLVVALVRVGGTTSAPAVIPLGRQLFFDSILSQNRSLACASCHQPQLAFTDGRATAKGVEGRVGNRNVPPLLNLPATGFFFWDGRETALRRQVLKPIQNQREMALNMTEAIARLQASPHYRSEFMRVFHSQATPATVGRSLAAYVMSIRSQDSAVDRYQVGDLDALTPAARRGFELFHGKASCAGCHSGPDLSDGQFHNTGVSWGHGDLGRQSVTGSSDDCGAFRTPKLREVARTAPYMHDGSMKSLDEVLEFYNKGGNPNPCMDMRVRQLHLSADDLLDLKAFLESLSGTIVEGKTK
jgi:cytochrome c peroxidase